MVPGTYDLALVRGSKYDVTIVLPVNLTGSTMTMPIGEARDRPALLTLSSAATSGARLIVTVTSTTPGSESSTVRVYIPKSVVDALGIRRGVYDLDQEPPSGFEDTETWLQGAVAVGEG